MPTAIDVGGPDAGVARITLARPDKRNALSIALRDEVAEAAAAPPFHRRLWEASDRFHRACLAFPLPLVAAVNGPAIAGGFDLAVMCDIRVAAATATFSHPELVFGDVVYSPLP